MNVLVIPEDFRHDQYMLKPIIQAMLAELGKPHARVDVLTDPLLGSISQALNVTALTKIIHRHKGMYDLFLLCVDRDGEEGRQQALTNIENTLDGDRLFFFGENAWQEIEVWLLAGLDLPKEWKWQTVRQERDPKEKYYYPFARERDVLLEPGEGRKSLGLEAAKNYGKRIRVRCPEDVKRLETRVQGFLSKSGGS